MPNGKKGMGQDCSLFRLADIKHPDMKPWTMGTVDPGTWLPNEETRIMLGGSHQIGKITQLNHS